MKKHLLTPTLLALVAGTVLISCSEDSDPQPADGNANSRVFATASGGSSESANARVIVNGFSSSEFTVATGEMEFRYAAKADIETGIDLGSISLKTNLNSSLQTSASETNSLALIASGDSQAALIAEGETPEGNYTEAEFLLQQNTEVDSSDPKYNKSLWIEGEIEGSQTIIWSETEKAIQAMAESSNGVVVEGQSDMMLEFDMEKLFEGVNFSLAGDGNADGTIEIGPDGEDGNALLYSRIMSNIESAVTLKSRN
ncbi:hypothetical protein [Algoriphagus sp.]|uniref:hypothetical protein n=1 Tax=Algoriphagus sp. TaxID=1872435 RepID=UPI00262E9281|nr:hypothetical protein [Algoriphagus sp.]